MSVVWISKPNISHIWVELSQRCMSVLSNVKWWYSRPRRLLEFYPNMRACTNGKTIIHSNCCLIICNLQYRGRKKGEFLFLPYCYPPCGDQPGWMVVCLHCKKCLDLLLVFLCTETSFHCTGFTWLEVSSMFWHSDFN